MRPATIGIVFVVSGFDVGGAELQLLQYVRRAPSRFDVRVIGLQEGHGAPLFHEFQAACRCESMPRGGENAPSFLGRLATRLRQSGAKVVHSFQDGSPGTWGRLAALLARTPHIVHSDRCHYPPVTDLQRRARPWLDRVTVRFFTNAKETAAWMRRRGVKRNRVVVIPNGVDLKRFAPGGVNSDRGVWGVPNEATVAGFLGRLRMEEKRLDILLDALTRMPESRRPDFVVIGGSGADERRVSEHVSRDPWLRQHVRMVGAVANAPAFLAGIDYLVLSSSSEGLPTVVLEAMAMKKPIIATAVSDVPEVLGGAGLLARAGDCDDLATAWCAMQALSADRRAEMGECGRARVESHFDIDLTATRFWEAHQQLCGGDA
jgi:starch synthase (maltosyl-transferring)